jgi:hypothetical protein
MSGRCPKLRMLCATPLMKGPALDVDNRSLVEAYSVMLSLVCSSLGHYHKLLGSRPAHIAATAVGLDRG